MIYGDDDRFYYLGQTSAKQNSEKIAVGVLHQETSTALQLAARQEKTYGIDHVFQKFPFLFFQALSTDRECLSKLKSAVKEMHKTGNSEYCQITF